MAWVASPGSAGAVDLGEGARLFNSNCARCHIQGQNLIVPEKNLQYATLQTYQMNSIEAIAYQVRHGKNIMPAFGDQFTDDQLTNLATYVLTTAQAGWDTVAPSPSRRSF
jgi:cytochrome c6